MPSHNRWVFRRIWLPTAIGEYLSILRNLKQSLFIIRCVQAETARPRVGGKRLRVATFEKPVRRKRVIGKCAFDLGKEAAHLFFVSRCGNWSSHHDDLSEFSVPIKVAKEWSANTVEVSS